MNLWNEPYILRHKVHFSHNKHYVKQYSSKPLSLKGCAFCLLYYNCMQTKKGNTFLCFPFSVELSENYSCCNFSLITLNLSISPLYRYRSLSAVKVLKSSGFNSSAFSNDGIDLSYHSCALALSSL